MNNDPRETVIEEDDGSVTTVRTDDNGTTVERHDEVVYSAGGDRHDEQVDLSTDQGGTVVSDD